MIEMQNNDVGKVTTNYSNQYESLNSISNKIRFYNCSMRENVR